MVTSRGQERAAFGVADVSEVDVQLGRCEQAAVLPVRVAAQARLGLGGGPKKKVGIQSWRPCGFLGQGLIR